MEIRPQNTQIDRNGAVASAESAGRPQDELATDTKPLFICVYLRLNCSS
jgi:hypothetical protein